MDLLHSLRAQVARTLDDFVVLGSDGEEIPEDAQPEPWTKVQWWNVFQLLFVSGPLVAADQDDLLFCVFEQRQSGKAFMGVRKDKPGELPPELAYGSRLYTMIDWRATVVLNIVMHTTYELQICAGRRASLHPSLRAAPSRTPPPQEHPDPGSCSLFQATVLPRLSRIPVDASGNYSKQAAPDQTYPYLAFTLDDFDDSRVDRLALQQPDDEFAVVMHARQWLPATARTSEAPAATASDSVATPDGTPDTTAASVEAQPPTGEGGAKVRLFCGFVDRQQVHESVKRRRSPLRSLLRRVSESAAAESESFFLRMNGPAGRGRAETVVTRRETPLATLIQSHKISSTALENGLGDEVGAHSAGAEGPLRAEGAEWCGVVNTQESRDAIADASGASAESPTALDGGSVLFEPGTLAGAREDAHGAATGGSGVGSVANGHAAEVRDGHGSDSSPVRGGNREMDMAASYQSSLRSAKKAAKQALGSLGLIDSRKKMVDYDCQFICLLLSVDDAISALLGLQQI